MTREPDFDFHMIDEHPYGLWTLYNAFHERPDLGSVRFIHPFYFDDPPSKPKQHNLTWEQWLHEFLGIRRNSRLISAGGCSISQECQYVQARLPARLLGFLRHNWAAESDRIKSNPLQILLLKKLVVHCEGGLQVPIDQAYFPLPILTSLRSRFMASDEPFPFFDLKDVTCENSSWLSWEFLRTLGVKGDPDLQFHLDILRYIVKQNWNFKTSLFGQPADISRILDLYKTIHGACISSSDTRADQIRTRYERKLISRTQLTICIVTSVKSTLVYSSLPMKVIVVPGHHLANVF